MTGHLTAAMKETESCSHPLTQYSCWKYQSLDLWGFLGKHQQVLPDSPEINSPLSHGQCHHPRNGTGFMLHDSFHCSSSPLPKDQLPLQKCCSKLLQPIYHCFLPHPPEAILLDKWRRLAAALAQQPNTYLDLKTRLCFESYKSWDNCLQSRANWSRQNFAAIVILMFMHVDLAPVSPQ